MEPNRKKVTLGFLDLHNFLQEFECKINNLVCCKDKGEPLDIHLVFPEHVEESLYNYGIDHILFITQYLYIAKHHGHPGSNIILLYI